MPHLPFRPRLKAGIGPVILLLVLSLPVASAAHAAQGDPTILAAMSPLMLLAWLVPLGVLLVAWGGLTEAQAGNAAAAALATLGLAVAGYTLIGFGLQYGGIGCLHDLPGLAQLNAEYTFIRFGQSWGLAGMSGFGLSEQNPAILVLFLSELPRLMTAALIPALVLYRQGRGWASAVVGLAVAAVIYPLIGNWTWAGGPTGKVLCAVNTGGWLGNLGVNSGLGHGFIDFGSIGAVHLLGGSVALAALLTFGPRLHPGNEMPPAHLPLLAAAGALIWAAVWPSWTAGHLLYQGADLPWALVSINALAGAGAGTLAAQAYSWLTTARPDALMAVRGFAAGLIAAGAGAPFLTPGQTLFVGLIAGVVVPLVVYAVEHGLRTHDPTGAVAVHLCGGLIGLIAVGLLAGGGVGAGWNGVGADTALGTGGRAVAGLLAGDRGQLWAQLVGIIVIVLGGLGPAWLIFQAVRAATSARLARRYPLPIAPRLEQEAADLSGLASARAEREKVASGFSAGIKETQEEQPLSPPSNP
ncbi:MAG: hypothetical protein C4311_07080 [Chloroflexota bacterium]